MPAVAAFAVAAFSAVSTAAAAVSAAVSGFMGMGIASFTGSLTIGTVLKTLSVGASLLSMAKRPKAQQGQPSPIAFKADPDASIPFVAGEAATGGNMVFAQTSGDKNRFLNYATVLSGGFGVERINPFTANDEVVTFPNDNGEGASGKYNNRMWMKFALGTVGAAALAFTSTANKYTPARNNPQLTEWTSQHKLTGLAHTLWAMWQDSERYPNGVPKPLWIVSGYKVYDPRKDSTFPGGDGPQRWNQPATWSFAGNKNPYLQAITFLIGFEYNGVRVGGAGIPITGIDLPAFVEGANVCDANGWTVSFVWNTSMRKWDVLTAFLQAGAGEPLARSSAISCKVETPKVSLGTIEAKDVVGDMAVTGTTSRRERINTVVPRFISPANKWTVQSAGEVKGATYIAEDGGKVRRREIAYESINNSRQAGQIAAYDLCRAREGIVATIPCRPIMLQYKAGDCITVNVPDALLNGQKVVVIKREFDVSTRICTLTVQSETDGKHAFALGQTDQPPASPVLSGIDPTIVQPPVQDTWIVTPGVSPGGDPGEGRETPVIVIVPTDPDEGGRIDEPNLAAVLVRYRKVGVDPDGNPWPWSYEEFPPTAMRIELKGLAAYTLYEVEIAYRDFRGVTSLYTPYGSAGTGGLVSTDSDALGGRQATDILESLDAVPGQINQAVANFNQAIAVIDAQINDPATGLKVRVGQVEVANADLAQRATVVEQEINRPGTGILARTGTLEQATTNLQQGKADASALRLVEARAGGDGALNLSPAFVSPWNSGVTLPLGYGEWAEGTRVRSSMVAGIEGPNALRMVAPADTDTGVSQGPDGIAALNVSPGWYVMEATVRLEAGSLVSSGLLIQSFKADASFVMDAGLNFANDPDISGVVHGAGTPGRTYRFAKLVQLTDANIRKFNWYVMASWGGLNPARPAKTIIVDRALVRPASAAEIDVGRARNGGSDLSARFGSLETATANLQTNKAEAARVSYLEAGSEDVYMTRNPTFTLYDDATTTGFTLPNYWYPWGGKNDDSHREPGYAGRYVWWSHNNKGNVTGDVGITQDYNNNPRLGGMAAGYYVLEAEVALDAGQIGGAGIYCYFANGGANSQARIDFGLDKTVDGTVLGYGFDAAGRYSWRKLVKLENVAQGNMVFHLMTDWDGFDAAGRPKVIRWQRCGIRRATAQEVAAERADTNAGSALARVTTQENVTAELVTRGVSGGNLVGNASLTNLVGWSISLPNNSESTLDRPSTGINFPNDNNWHPPGENCLSSHVNAPDASWYMDWFSDGFALEPGKTYEFGAQAGQHRCETQVYIQITNVAAGGDSYPQANVYPTSAVTATEAFSGGINLANYAKFWGKFTCPAGVTRGRLILRRFSTGPSYADSWSWFTRPFCREITPGQTQPSAWDAGSAQWNLKASWAVGASVPGADAFIQATAQLSNGKASSSVAIGADQFVVFNKVSGNWLKALEVVNGNVLLTGGLQAGAFIRLGNGVGWPVALKPVDFNASDGEVVSFGTDLGGLPSLQFAQNNLAPLNSGETYDVRASGLTATGFTLYAKINVPAAPSNQSANTTKDAATLAGSPGVQLYLDGKPESVDGTYRVKANGVQTHRFIGRQGQQAEADSGSYVYVTVPVWAYKGGWVQVATLTAVSFVDPYQYASGQIHTTTGPWSIDETIQMGSGVTHVFAGYGGSDNGYGGYVSTTGPVTWQAQGAASGVRSATPSGQKTRVTVRPQ